jgi:GNAT superfamily N-acetyltransferase
MSFAFVRMLPDDILAKLEEITAVYQAAFTPPPYQKPLSEIVSFARSLPNQLDREDYRFFAAIAEDGGKLAGFAYGHSVRAGLWWQEQVRRVLPEQVAAEWLPDSFEFVELAVIPQYQRQGIGSQLHDRLLEGVAYDL